MVFQISEMKALIIIWLLALEFVFDHTWYKYEIIGYCVLNYCLHVLNVVAMAEEAKTARSRIRRDIFFLVAGTCCSF